jgi:hypothetical protein
MPSAHKTILGLGRPGRPAGNAVRESFRRRPADYGLVLSTLVEVTRVL